jgi:hypothetical protein
MKYFYMRKIIEYNWTKLGFELLVVFLGVTGAFVLNNWQNDRQDSGLERKYIARFLEDINSNIDQFEQSVARDSIFLNRARPYFFSFKYGKTNRDTAMVIMEFSKYFSRSLLARGTYRDIINSGNLRIIEDIKLKSYLVDYFEESMDMVEFFDDLFFKYFNDYVLPFRMNEFDIIKNTFNNPEVIYTSRFSNMFAGGYSYVLQRTEKYREVLKKSYALRDYIKNDLHL